MNSVAIIDRNNDWIKIFIDFFHTVGYTVSTFENTGDLLNSAHKTKIADAIIYPVYSEGADPEKIREIKKRFSKTPLILFLSHPEIPECVRYLKNHADGLVLKQDGIFALYSAVLSSITGGIFISPAINKALITHLFFGDDTRMHLNFTLREKEIIQVLKEGHSYKQMANKLGITTFTVNHHLKKLYKKAGVNSRTQLIALMDKGLVQEN